MSSGADRPRLLCACRLVEWTRIDQLMEQGMRRAVDLMEATGAGGGCGTCRASLYAYLVEKRKARDRAALEGSAPSGQRPG